MVHRLVAKQRPLDKIHLCTTPTGRHRNTAFCSASPSSPLLATSDHRSSHQEQANGSGGGAARLGRRRRRRRRRPAPRRPPRRQGPPGARRPPPRRRRRPSTWPSRPPVAWPWPCSVTQSGAVLAPFLMFSNTPPRRTTSRDAALPLPRTSRASPAKATVSDSADAAPQSRPPHRPARPPIADHARKPPTRADVCNVRATRGRRASRARRGFLRLCHAAMRPRRL